MPVTGLTYKAVALVSGYFTFLLKHNMTQVSFSSNALEPVLDASNADAQMKAEQYEIATFRTEKFDNHDEDSSRVDSLSDSPAVMGVFRRFCNSR